MIVILSFQPMTMNKYRQKYGPKRSFMDKAWDNTKISDLTTKPVRWSKTRIKSETQLVSRFGDGELLTSGRTQDGDTHVFDYEIYE